MQIIGQGGVAAGFATAVCVECLKLALRTDMALGGGPLQPLRGARRILRHALTAPIERGQPVLRLGIAVLREEFEECVRDRVILDAQRLQRGLDAGFIRVDRQRAQAQRGECEPSHVP